MPQEITAYRAEDGSIHATACEAATRDLEGLIAASPLAENTPYAKKLADWLTSSAPAILKVLGEYAAACPIPPKEEAPSESSEGTREIEHKRFCQSQDGAHPCDCGAE